MNNKLAHTPNPTLVTLRDNKAKWNLPEYRRTGYRNLHKINRYGILLRSDYVLTLNENTKNEIREISSVKEMTSHKSFCSLIVGKGQDIFYEKYAEDFSSSQPQTIMSISKMFLNLFVGELLEKGKLQLEKPISYYLPNIGSGYAKATVQNVLNMNIVNAFTEDYTDPYSTSFMHETVGGWRIPGDGTNEVLQEDFLNKIETDVSGSVANNTDNAYYKSANSDVIALLIEKISDRKLRDWLLSSVEAMGFEDGLYMATDRGGMPWLSGGGCLMTRDFLRMGLLFSRRGRGIRDRIIGSEKFINETVSNKGPKYMHLKDGKYVYYANQTMKSNNWIGHSGYGGQFLMINLETNVVAGFFSVLETDSATDEEYKTKMILMLEEVTSKKYS